MTAHDPRITQAAVIRRLIAPLARFFDDRSLFEIIVNRPGEVFIEGAEGWARHEIQEVTFEALMSFAKAVATYSAQKIDATNPVLSATLPGNERIQTDRDPAGRASGDGERDRAQALPGDDDARRSRGRRAVRWRDRSRG